MREHRKHLKNWLAMLSMIALLCIGTSAYAQNAPAQNDRTVQDNDATIREVVQFDQFLDSHPEIAEQLHKDPTLINNREFVESHAALQTYLQDHPETREQIKQDLNAFMRHENAFDLHENEGEHNIDRGEVARFDQFLDGHPEIAEQLRKDPGLVNNREFVDTHAALQTYLQDHPEIRDQIKQDPNAFMRREDNLDARDNGVDRAEAARFDQFLDGHREIAEQLRKDPGLVNNREFMESHAALQTYLQDHPEISQQLRQDPNAFMRREDSFDHENAGDHGFDREHLASFKKFLDGHSDISQQLSHDPTLAKNDEYLHNHAEFQEYLNANPGVRGQLMQNPDGFIKSAQQFNAPNNNGWNGSTQAPPIPDTKTAPGTKQK